MVRVHYWTGWCSHWKCWCSPFEILILTIDGLVDAHQWKRLMLTKKIEPAWCLLGTQFCQAQKLPISAIKWPWHWQKLLLSCWWWQSPSVSARMCLCVHFDLWWRSSLVCCCSHSGLFKGQLCCLSKMPHLVLPQSREWALSLTSCLPMIDHDHVAWSLWFT